MVLTPTQPAASPSRGGGETRSQVISVLLKRAPVAAADVADELGLSTAGVRRHLDRLVEDGLAETCAPRAVAGEEQGRGRPAKHFRLTAAGREQFGSDYDALAVEAVDLIAELGGEDAVRRFAQARAERIFAGVEPVSRDEATVPSEATGPSEPAVRRVAAALEAHGYVPSLRRTAAGIQICQHHCPVSAVAAAYPEFCEAEHEVLAKLVDTHVQPLALIADGHGVCTTNIPLAAAARTHTKGAADND